MSFSSHPWRFAAAFKHGIHVYNVLFGAHYRHRIETTKSWGLNDVSMETRHWMERGEMHTVGYFVLSGCSDPDESPMAQSVTGTGAI